jgi:hypothetical protein
MGDFMINLYISTFKDVLKNFYNDVTKLNSELENIECNYSGELLQSKLADVNTRKNTAYNNSKKLIDDTFTDVRNLLAIANFPNVTKLTDDKLLFERNTGIELTPQEIGAFIEKYADNYTMLRFIKNWIERNPKRTTEFAEVAKQIYLPEDKVQVYKKFAISALSILDTIYNATPDTFAGIEVMAYADENFSANLFSVIGNGENLKEYKTADVPESAKHIFDDIYLQLDTNVFAFKPLNRK